MSASPPSVPVLPFDNIVVRTGESIRNLSVEGFLALDLPTRIRHVMAGEVEFRLGHEKIPQGEALGALQRMSARQARA